MVLLESQEGSQPDQKSIRPSAMFSTRLCVEVRDTGKENLSVPMLVIRTGPGASFVAEQWKNGSRER